MTRRYHGHLALGGFDSSSQQRLSSASVMLVGLGGVGCAAAQYLAAAGVGDLLLCDFDRISETNLSRQILYRDADLGRPKTEVAGAWLAQLNPNISIRLSQQRIDSPSAAQLGGRSQLWVDTSDNWATRMAINEAAVALGQPWVMAAAIRREGQLALFQPGGHPQPGCYACIYGEAAGTMDNCAGAGVLSTVAGAVGVAAAQMALMQLTGGPLPDGLQLYDGDQLRWRSLDIGPNPDCPVCRA